MDKAVAFNRADITSVDETKKEAAFIWHSNSINLQYTIHNCRKIKQIQYKVLAFENNQQWQLNKIIVIPLVLSAMG
jgi:hypothetical protein